MSTKIMRRGQVWFYNANPIIGDEIGKTRPAVIVNNNDSDPKFLYRHLSKFGRYLSPVTVALL